MRDGNWMDAAESKKKKNDDGKQRPTWELQLAVQCCSQCSSGRRDQSPVGARCQLAFSHTHCSLPLPSACAVPIFRPAVCFRLWAGRGCSVLGVVEDAGGARDGDVEVAVEEVVVAQCRVVRARQAGLSIV